MATRDTHWYAQAKHKDPGGPARSNDDQQPSCPQLRRISEVDRNCDPASPLAGVLDWVRGFLARPHPQLGRHGSVCPFIPNALGLDTIWIAEVVDASPGFDRISAIITGYRDLFLQTDPNSGPEAINKAFVVVFSSLMANSAEDLAVIDKVQASLKKYFVEMGLMLGEFHAGHESPGLRNPDFRPLRSSVPMLAIRYMVESDLPFLARKFYLPEERSFFLRSYLFRLGGTLSEAKFKEAVDALIVAEMAIVSKS
jgi:hypothetical protein